MPKPHDVRQCTVCVLDNAVFDLKFNEAGQCDACASATARKEREWLRGEVGAKFLDVMAQHLRAKGIGKKYDAMIGLSGGIDSAYLAHLAVKQMGLRVLAVHVDAGWNSLPAVRNIRRIVSKLAIDLHTEVVEWDDIADLQYAFLKAGVFNQDLPQDHAFFSTLFRTADAFGISTFLSGVNFATESVSPRHAGPSYLDGKHIAAIHNRFGRHPLRHMKLMGIVWYLTHVKLFARPNILRPLDFIGYDKEKAKQFLESEYGWVDYGRKHSESRFTEFYQDVYLPRKFGFDKRQIHLSSLIVAGAMSREQALAELLLPICSPQKAKRDTAFVAKKLNMDSNELEACISAPPIDHSAYPSSKKFIDRALGLRRLVHALPRRVKSA